LAISISQALRRINFLYLTSLGLLKIVTLTKEDEKEKFLFTNPTFPGLLKILALKSSDSEERLTLNESQKRNLSWLSNIR